MWIETSFTIFLILIMFNVTPHAGVWIETLDSMRRENGHSVTPHAGVWIETV